MILLPLEKKFSSKIYNFFIMIQISYETINPTFILTRLGSGREGGSASDPEKSIKGTSDTGLGAGGP